VIKTSWVSSSASSSELSIIGVVAKGTLFRDSLSLCLVLGSVAEGRDGVEWLAIVSEGKK
jgi:hypothetical protein